MKSKQSFLLVLLTLTLQLPAQESNQTVGVGMVKPKLAVEEALEFFPAPLARPPAYRQNSIASVTFVQGEYNLEIGSAPAWFAPEVLKLDYDILLLRAQTLTDSRIEVVVNRETGRTAWVERSAVEFLDWPSFWLTVYSVEVQDLNANPVRTRPLDHAARVLSAKDRSYRVVAVRGNWLRIASADPTGDSRPIGWIRWQDGQKVLVGYSLLS